MVINIVQVLCPQCIYCKDTGQIVPSLLSQRKLQYCIAPLPATVPLCINCKEGIPIWLFEHLKASGCKMFKQKTGEN